MIGIAMQILDTFCSNTFLKICFIIFSPLLTIINLINPIFMIIYCILVLVLYFSIKEPKYLIHYNDKTKKEKKFGVTMKFVLYLCSFFTFIMAIIGVMTSCKVNDAIAPENIIAKVVGATSNNDDGEDDGEEGGEEGNEE